MTHVVYTHTHTHTHTHTQSRQGCRRESKRKLLASERAE
jgi:hypothetical protein